MAALAVGLAASQRAAPAAAHSASSVYTWTRQVDFLLSADHVTLHYSLAAGDLLGQQLRRQIDSDADGLLGATERQRFLEKIEEQVRPRLELTVDGAAASVSFGQRGQLILGDDVGAGSVNVELYMDVPLASRRTTRHRLVFRDASAVEKLADNLVQIVELDRCTRVSSRLDDGAASDRADYAFPQRADPTGYEIALEWDCAAANAPGKPPHPTAGGAGTSPPAEQSRMAALISQQKLSPAVVMLALSIALLLGAAHALSPGHGKTVVAAYLVGSHGTVWHAVLLGIAVTFTHVTSVVLLGVVTLWLSAYVVPERILPWLGFSSGLLIVVVGIWMLVVRVRALRTVVAPHHPHHPHRHAHDHDHHHHHAVGHEGGTPARIGQLVALGVTGGLMPCPSALVVLLTAVALHRILFGLALIGSFSAGLALVLILIGILMIKARGLIDRIGRLDSVSRRLPVASAAVVTVFGVIIAVQALVAGNILDLRTGG